MTIQTALAALILVASAPMGAQTTRLVDTTVAVDSVGRVKISDRNGRLTVRSWSEAKVRVRTTLREGESVQMDRQASGIHLGRVVNPLFGALDVEIWVPQRAVLEIHHREGAVDVAGVDGSMGILGAVSSVKVSGGRAPITVNTSAGDIEVTGSAASLALTSSAGNITVRGSSGDVSAHSNAGALTIEDVRAMRVSATSLRGDVRLRGAVASGADVTLDSHSGTLTIALAAGSNATVRARSISGRVEGTGASMSLREGTHELIVGKGTATIRATSFSGPIRVTVK